MTVTNGTLPGLVGPVILVVVNGGTEPVAGHAPVGLEQFWQLEGELEVHEGTPTMGGGERSSRTWGAGVVVGWKCVRELARTLPMARTQSPMQLRLLCLGQRMSASEAAGCTAMAGRTWSPAPGWTCGSVDENVMCVAGERAVIASPTICHHVRVEVDCVRHHDGGLEGLTLM